MNKEEMEAATMLLRRIISSSELAGKLSSNDAVRFTESLFEMERALIKTYE